MIYIEFVNKEKIFYLLSFTLNSERVIYIRCITGENICFFFFFCTDFNMHCETLFVALIQLYIYFLFRLKIVQFLICGLNQMQLFVYANTLYAHYATRIFVLRQEEWIPQKVVKYSRTMNHGPWYRWMFGLRKNLKILQILENKSKKKNWIAFAFSHNTENILKLDNKK